MRRIRERAFRIWVPGIPLSAGKSGKTRTRYTQSIREAASKVVPFPTNSFRIDIEIFFQADTSLRADVDNVIKPILDAFVGVVYHDDRQVRSVKGTALPVGEPFGLSGWMSMDVFNRLTKETPQEFLVTIYEGLSTPAP